jgi:hypothetical protein
MTAAMITTSFSMEYQPIWKAACSTAPMMLSHPSPNLGVEQDAIHRPLDLIEELQTQARCSVLVILDGLRQVRLRGGEESVGHLLKRVRRSRRTPGPSRAATSPRW